MSEIDRVFINRGVANLASGEHYAELNNGSDNDVYFVNEVNSESKLHVNQIDGYNCVMFNVKKGSHFILTCQLAYIVYKPINIKVYVHSNASFEAYFAELTNCNVNVNLDVYLLEENAEASIKFASISFDDYNKKINVNVEHMVPKTYGKVDCYGICKDESKLLFAGTSHIVNGAIKSKTQQNARIMVFDEASDGVAKPILKIDENDIEASHAAVVGRINDEHLFYLTSRGISEAEAKHLITMGYFKPIISGFNDAYKEFISSLIERRM